MKKEILFPRLFILTFVSSIAFLSFVLGTAVMSFKIKPLYRIFHDSYEAAKSWQEKLTPSDRYSQRYLFYPARYEQTGIIRYDPKKAYNGYTLFTSTHAHKAFLISMKGDIVHEWEIPFSQVWPSPPHIKSPSPDEFGFLRKAYLFPNGDLIATYENINDTPSSYGMVKINKDSQIIWKYAAPTHHDLDVGSDGKIYTLLNEISNESVPGFKKSASPWLKDYIAVLSPQGQEIQRIDVVKAFLNSDFAGYLNFNQDWDFLHTNGVEVLTPKLASQFPMFKEGQVLISIRSLSVIAVVDLEQEKVIWATRGIWNEQHDADFLENGNILLFDNLGNPGKGGSSRIVEFDPKNLEIIWQYAGTETEPFYSKVRADQQRLPNGNTLITESDPGRLFEVTPDGEIVWEYSSPFRVPQNKQRTAIISWSQRFAPDTLQFEFSSPKH